MWEEMTKDQRDHLKNINYKLQSVRISAVSLYQTCMTIITSWHHLVGSAVAHFLECSLPRSNQLQHAVFPFTPPFTHSAMDHMSVYVSALFFPLHIVPNFLHSPLWNVICHFLCVWCEIGKLLLGFTPCNIKSIFLYSCHFGRLWKQVGDIRIWILTAKNFQKQHLGYPGHDRQSRLNVYVQSVAHKQLNWISQGNWIERNWT